MKKLLGFLFLIFMGSLAHADLFDFTQQKEYEINFSSQSPTTVSGVSTLVLIDLSDTATWPHKEKKAIHITSIQCEIDKAAASTTTVRMGVVNYVGVSSGSITWFYDKFGALNVSNTNVVAYNEYPNYGINTKVNLSTGDFDGTTPYILSTDKSSLTTSVKLNTNLSTIVGTQVFPAVGDILIELTKGAAAINYSIRVKYYSEN